MLEEYRVLLLKPSQLRVWCSNSIWLSYSEKPFFIVLSFDGYVRWTEMLAITYPLHDSNRITDYTKSLPTLVIEYWRLS